MSFLTLRKIFSPKGAFVPPFAALLAALPLPPAIVDRDGTVLFGDPATALGAETPVIYAGQYLGRVCGEPYAPLVARLLEAYAAGETEKKDLAAEVLDKYRELSLLYNLSGALASSPQRQALTQFLLERATRLIAASAGVVWLVDHPNGAAAVEPAAGLATVGRGAAPQLAEAVWAPDGLLQRVLVSGRAELENAAPGAAFLAGSRSEVSALCAPLRTEKRTLGAILLVHARPEAYTAGDLKLLNAIASQAAPAIEIAQLYRVAVEKARLEHELQTAYKVQSGLLPEATPALPGWDFAGLWQPAREVSGDYYDFIPAPDGALGLAIADVTDKGMPASLFMVFTRTALRSSIGRGVPPWRTLHQTNQILCGDSQHGLFTTLVYARLSPRSGRLTYANAGHNPPLHYRWRADRFEQLDSTGIPLGIFDDASYTQNVLRLLPGDFLLMYTDGVTEAMDADDRQFGLERMQAVAYAHRHAPAQELVAAILQAVQDWRGATPQSDDVTLLAARRLPALRR